MTAWAKKQTVFNAINENGQVFNMTLTDDDVAFLKKNNITIVESSLDFIPKFIELNTPREHALLAMRIDTSIRKGSSHREKVYKRNP